MRSRRLAAAVAVASAAALTLAGCTGGGGALSSNDNSGSVTKLTIPTNQSPWLPYWKELASKYTKKTGVKIDLRPVPYGQLKSQLINDVQTKSHAFDIYQIDESWQAQFLTNGWLQPYTDIDSAYRPDPATNDYHNFAWWNSKKNVATKDGGKVYLQPLQGNMQLLMYRKDIYKKLGLTVPSTWQEAIANGKEIQKSGLAQYGYMLRTQGDPPSSSTTYDFTAIFYSYGGAWFKSPGTNWTPTADSPAGVEAATIYRQLAELGPEAVNTIGQAQIISEMQAGNVGQVQIVAAAAAQMNDPDASSVAGKVGYAPLPAGSKRAEVSGVWALGVPSGISDKRAKAALKFIKWVESKKAQTEFAALGGIPTRNDVLDSPKIPEKSRAYLEAVAKGSKNTGPQFRWLIAPKVLEHTETVLPRIAGGKVSPGQGMKEINSEVLKEVQKAGLPH